MMKVSKQQMCFLLKPLGLVVVKSSVRDLWYLKEIGSWNTVKLCMSSEKRITDNETCTYADFNDLMSDVFTKCKMFAVIADDKRRYVDNVYLSCKSIEEAYVRRDLLDA